MKFTHVLRRRPATMMVPLPLAATAMGFLAQHSEDQPPPGTIYIRVGNGDVGLGVGIVMHYRREQAGRKP